MIKKYEFIERTVYLIRKALEEQLPKEDTLEDMIKVYNKVIKKLSINKEVI